MAKQPDITNGMRAILVDWLVEVVEEFKLEPQTFYLSMSIVDRFLSCMSVLRSKLQLVGTAGVYIAAKFEEIYPPEIGDFVYITDDTYTKSQVHTHRAVDHFISLGVLSLSKRQIISKSIDDCSWYMYLKSGGASVPPSTYLSTALM